jgi:hypothetical protein
LNDRDNVPNGRERHGVFAAKEHVRRHDHFDSDSFALELSYRYLKVGNAQSGRVLNLDPTIVPINLLAQVTFHNIQSNDIIRSARVPVQ